MVAFRQAVLNQDADAAAQALLDLLGEPPERYSLGVSWQRKYDNLTLLIAKAKSSNDWSRLERMVSGVVDERKYFGRLRYHKRRKVDHSRAPQEYRGVVDDETGQIVRSHSDDQPGEETIYQKVMGSDISSGAKELFAYVFDLLPDFEAVHQSRGERRRELNIIFQCKKSGAVMAARFGCHINTITARKNEVRRVLNNLL